MALTPIDVQQKTFGTALRGYDLDEVDDFLDDVVTTLKSYEERLAEGQARITELEADLAGKGDSESAISRALVAAQRSADMIVEEAKSESARILEDAKAQNERLTAIRDEEQAKLDVEVAGIRSGISEIRAKVKELASSVEADLDEMDRVVDDGHADAIPVSDVSTDVDSVDAEPADSMVVQALDEGVAPIEADAGVTEDGDVVDAAGGDAASESPVGEAETMQMTVLAPDAATGSVEATLPEGDGADPLDAAIAEATFKSWVPEATDGAEVDSGWPGGQRDLTDDEDDDDDEDLEDWTDEALAVEAEQSDEADGTDAWERAGFDGWGENDADEDKPRRPWE